MLKWLLHHQLLQAVVVVLIGLVLFGNSSAESLAGILGLYAALKLVALLGELFKKRPPPIDWAQREAHWTGLFGELEPEDLETVAVKHRLEPKATLEEIVRERLGKERAAVPLLRPKPEIAAEMVGVLGFVVLLPPVIALYTHDFYSPRMGHGWAGAAVVVLAMALLLTPRFWSKAPSLSPLRILWWTVPVVPLLLAFVIGIETQHPYLNPFRDDQHKLAADRVLALRDNIFAGNYADWVMTYARELDAKGERGKAVHYYRAALRLNPSEPYARARLAVLGAGAETPALEQDGRPSPTALFWSRNQTLAHAPRIKIDASLENVAGCTVVLVPLGVVPDHLLDAVAHTIEQELALPVKVRSTAVPQPPHTRVRGLATGPQWDVLALVKAFLDDASPVPSGPMRYVVITPLDVYINDSNFAFSGSFEFGALVSFARFGPPEPDSLCEHRLAKQCLGALLKSFRIEPSLDRDCVTSYTSSLEEFDQKGNRPNAATLAQFQRTIAAMNESWRRFKASR